MDDRRSTRLGPLAAALGGLLLGIAIVAIWFMRSGGTANRTGLLLPADSAVPAAESARDAEVADSTRRGIIHDMHARVSEQLAENAPVTTRLRGSLRVRAADLVWHEQNGSTFARVSRASAILDADAAGRGDILLSDVALSNAVVNLRQATPAARWNYEVVLAEVLGGEGRNSSRAPSGRKRTFALNGVRIDNTLVDVRLPDQHLIFRDVDANLARIVFSEPGRSVPELLLTRVDTELDMPARGQRIALAAEGGRIRFLDEGVGFEINTVMVEEAQLADLAGIWSGDLPGYGVRATGRAVDLQLASIRFLAPERIPEEGMASFAFAVDPVDEDRTHITLTNIAASSGDSRVTGDLSAFVLANGFQLEDADLRVDPLQLALIERVLGRELPYTGTLTGSVRGSGGDIRFDLNARLTAPGVGPPLLAQIEGRLALFDGQPTLRGVAVTLDNAPLAALRPLLPGLPFGGTISGRIALEGSPNSAPLDVDVRLDLAEGTVTALGTVDLTGAIPRYDLTGDLIGVNLQAVFATRAPPVTMTANFAVNGMGTDPATLNAQLELNGRFSGWQARAGDGVRLSARIQDGTADVDTLAVQLATMFLDADGAWRFVEPQSGAIDYLLAVTSLQPWGPYIPVVGDSTAAGSIEASGRVEGPLSAIRVAGRVDAEELRLGSDWSANVLEGEFDVAFGGPVPRITADFSGRGIGTPTAGAYEVATVNLQLTDPSFALEVRADRVGGGIVEVVADGRVPYEGAREVVVQRARLDLAQGQWTLTQPATINWGTPDGLAVRNFELRDQETEGRIALDGVVFPLHNADVAIDIAALPVGDVQALLGQQPYITGDVWAQGTFNGAIPRIDLTFRLDSGVVSGIDVRNLNGTVEYADGSLHTIANMSFDTAGTLEIDARLPMIVAFEDSTRFELLDDGAIEGRIVAQDVALSPLNVVVPFVRDARGRVNGTVTLGGTVAAPELAGDMTLANGDVVVPMLNVHFRQVEARASLAGRVLTLESLRAQAGGFLDATGTITFTELTRPTVNITAQLDAFQPLGVDDLPDAEMTGTVRLEGPLSGIVMTGAIAVADGYVPIPEVGGGIDEDVFATGSGIDPLNADAQPSLLDGLTIRDLNIEVQEDVWFTALEARAQLAGDLVVNKSGSEYRVQGDLEGEGGSYTLEAGPIVRRFDIAHARVRFLGLPEPNPAIDITATRSILTETGPIEVEVRIGGTLKAPTLTLASSSAANIPQSELLSFLLFGRASSSLGGDIPGEALLTQTVLGGVEEMLALRIEEAFAEGLGTSLDVFQVRFADGVFGVPTLVVGQEIADDVFLTVESALSALFGEGTSTADAWAIRLEWAFAEQSSVRAGIEPVRSVQLLRGLDVALPTKRPRQFSLEVRRRWTY